MASRSAVARAPRLSPSERIGAHITRRGRFRRIDPRTGRPPPGLARLAAALGWLVLLEESLRRAWRAQRAGEAHRQ